MKSRRPFTNCYQKSIEIFKCAVRPPETQQPQQVNPFTRVEQSTPPVLRVIGESPRVPRAENKTPSTLTVEPIVPRIQVTIETQYYTNKNDATVNLTIIQTDVVPPLHQNPTRRRLRESANHIATVTPDVILLPK